MYSVVSASITDIGKVRQVNEDAVLERGNLFAVADGMGGHQAGEVASALALSVIEQYVEDNIGTSPGERLVENAVSSANAAVYNKAASGPRFHDMGTTVTLLYREGTTAYIGHVGDSRAYLLRGGKLRQLTQDHSLVEKLVEEGEITRQEARSHPQRNIILRALGLEPRVEVDVISVDIEPGDVFLLATDGLFSEVADPDMERVLNEDREPGGAVRRLVGMALEAGGGDNVSAVIVGFNESPTTVAAAESQGGEWKSEFTHPPAARPKVSSRLLRNWVIALGLVFVLLGAAFAVGYYFHNRTFYVGVKEGRITLYRGFPFWGLASVEKRTDMEVRFLPDVLRQKVERNLEAESRTDAFRTLRSLEREIEKNSSLVPDVEGRQFDEARALLEKAGLVAEPRLVSRPGMTPGVVLVQEPQPGTRAGKGSSVQLKVILGGTQPQEV